MKHATFRPRPVIRWRGNQPRLAEATVPRLSTSTALLPAYDAASTGRRTRSWQVSSEGPNTLIFGSGDILRARTRDQIRKNPWAAQALRCYVANAIGTGIRPKSLHSDEKIREELHRRFDRWCYQADADGRTDFYGLQALACRSLIEGGECFIRLRPRRLEDGLAIPLQLQVLEAEHCPTTKNETALNGNTIRAGIEFDRIGRRVAYHLYREHPGDSSVFSQSSSETVRVPAEFVLHLYQMLRPGQLRGEPWFAPSLVRLWGIDKTDDANLEKQTIGNMFIGHITKNSPDDSFFGESNEDVDNDNVPIANVEPGTINELLPGEDIKWSQPPGAGEYEQAIRPQLRAAAAGIGVTYDMMTGDRSQVNFSSIRSGILEFRRVCEQLQYFTVGFQMLRPTWAKSILQSVFAGDIDSKTYLANPHEYLTIDCRPPGWWWVQPMDDIEAHKIAVRCGFETRGQVVGEKGYDIEEVDREIAADKKRAEALGLVFDSDASQTAATAAGRPKEQGNGKAESGNQ